MTIFAAKKSWIGHLNWHKRVDHHAAVASNILAQIQEVKMLGLGTPLSKHMQKQQEAEIKASMVTLQCTTIKHAFSELFRVLAISVICS